MECSNEENEKVAEKERIDKTILGKFQKFIDIADRQTKTKI